MPKLVARETGTGSTHSGEVIVERATTGDVAISVTTAGDTTDRIAITGDGNVAWGDGTTASQVGLRRAASVYGTLELINPQGSGGAAMRLRGVTGTPEFVGRRAPGAIDTPTPTQSGNVLVSLDGQGHNGTDWISGSRVELVAGQSFGVGTTGAYISLSTTTIGTTTAAERARLIDAALEIGGTFATPGATERLRINTPTTLDAAANVQIGASATTAKPLILQGAAGQSANLFELQDSTGALLASVNATGTLDAAGVTSGGHNLVTPAIAIETTGEPTGFVNRTDSTIAITVGAPADPLTFTIAPAVTSFAIWVAGVYYTKLAAAQVTIPKVTGTTWIYFDSAGVLQTSGTTWEIAEPTAAPVAIVYYSATSNDYILMDERHGVLMDAATHDWIHDTQGSSYASGLTIGNYSIASGSPVDAHNTFSMDAGYFFDEDLKHHPLSLAAGGGADGYPVLWRSGASEWVWGTPGPAFPFKVGATYIQYNSYGGGVWSLAEATNGDYVNYWVFATGSVRTKHQFIILPGQAKYATLAAAQASTLLDLNLSGLPFIEAIARYKVTMRLSSGYATTGKCRIEGVQQLLGNITLAQNAGLVPYVLKSGDTMSGTLQISNVQPALNTLLRLTGTPAIPASTNAYSILMEHTYPATATGTLIGLAVQTNTAAASYTATALYGARLAHTWGAGSGATTAYGLHTGNFGNANVATTYGVFVEPQVSSSVASYGARIDAATTQTLWLSGNADNTTAAAGIAFGLSKDTNLYRYGPDGLKTDDAFYAAATLGVGITPNSDYKAAIGGTIAGTSATVYGFSSNVTTPATATTATHGAYIGVKTEAAAFTCANAYSLLVPSPTLGAGSAITTASGLRILAQKVTGVGTGYGIYQVGTSDLNFFGGKVGIGAVTPGTNGLQLFVRRDVSQTDLGVGTQTGAQISTYFTCSDDTAQYVYGTNVGSSFDVAAGKTLTPTDLSSSGLFASVSKTGTGILTIGISHVVGYGAVGGGVINAYYGMMVRPIRGTGGTATNAYGIAVQNQGAAHVGTSFGIRVEAQSGSTTASHAVAISASTTSTLWLSYDVDNTVSSAGIAFGLSRDTVLYRSAAGTLKTDSRLWVGGAPSGMVASTPLAINGPYSATHGAIAVWCSDALAINKGGVIGFGGVYTGVGAQTDWAQIRGLKTSATDGEYGGYLQFLTRPNGGSETVRMTIDESGGVGVNTSPTSAYRLYARANTTHTSGSGERALYGQTVWTGSGTVSGTNVYGSSAAAYIDIAAGGDFQGPDVTAQTYLLVHQNDGNVTCPMVGVKGYMWKYGAGTLTTYRSMECAAPQIFGGAVTTAIGVFVNGMKIAGVTTGWGIWTSGSSDYNHFAGYISTGPTAVTHSRFFMSGTNPGTDTTSYGMNLAPVAHASSTVASYAFYAKAATVASAFTCPILVGVTVATPTVGAGSTVTNLYGVQVKAQTGGSTGSFGVAVEAATTATLWVSSNADNTTAAAGIMFGSSRDTNLYRADANRLKTDDSFQVNGTMAIGTTPDANTTLSVAGTPTAIADCMGMSSACSSHGGAQNYLTSAAFQINVAAASSVALRAVGVRVDTPTFGAGSSATALYGIYVDSQTGGSSSYGVAIAAAGTQTLWLSSKADVTSADGGIAFGVSCDTNIYRGGANQLKTDDDLVVAGAYVSVGSTAASTGYVRLPNNTGIYSRDKDNAGDLVLVRSDNNDYVYLGSWNDGATYIGGTWTQIWSGVLVVGDSAAGTGGIRLPNNVAIDWRNGDGDGDVAGIKVNAADQIEIQNDALLTDGKNLVVGTSTGTMLGSAANQKLAAYGVAPDIQPTTGISGATVVVNAGSNINDATTFDGYTIAQVVAALRREGWLA